ncbi:MAG: hypothetical protein HYU64_06605 [Armatimonadetes bacterium]|nr:hypothetical protein [Armatimonadota bacterium]
MEAVSSDGSFPKLEPLWNLNVTREKDMMGTEGNKFAKESEDMFGTSPITPRSLSQIAGSSGGGNDHEVAKAILDGGPRTAVTGGDIYLGQILNGPLSNSTATDATIAYGILRGVYGICEGIYAAGKADSNEPYGQWHVKGAGDILAGIGLISTASGAGPAGIVITAVGDLVSLFASMRDRLD